MGQQHQADAGRVQGEPTADPGEHRDGRATGDPLDEDGLGAVADGQLDVLPGDDVEVLEVGQGHLPQRGAPRRERTDLPEPEPDPVARRRRCARGHPSATSSAARRCAVDRCRPAAPGELGQR